MKAPVTETQWLVAGSWFPVCEAVQRRQNARKMRLFGCACCRRLGNLLTDERSFSAIEVAEQFADGAAKRTALVAAQAIAHAAVNELGQTEYKWEPDGWAANAVAMVVHGTAKIYFQLTATRAAEAIGQAGVRTNAAERAIQFGLLRDIFGNPFRPAIFSPSWRTSTTVALAAQMYESRDFSTMPILADSLQDAGCDSAEVLDHCRGGGPHVRGCWVIDLALGKA
ncbi:Uncharacterized protein OS=Sorangium cellulosum (strain So ce56) GN=sce5710 PE=4 SV=1 [Gemmata massiliana]|uniref:SMI1/KNR4 family protein n=1 Tax=Gemmata massiliana TaxID=1210884 RepID=A0A6P2D3S0_9BACT|nr:hypothetical protein [Gemmata massiliana]VTR94744.1 Uncharacterized protein OS=Sorangium cellulosum (strain So ce56) GN=sce5710 PE=4 SV=1 [Gemmata massiliana]